MLAPSLEWPGVKRETPNVKLVLASASPRRAELLRNAGIEFVVLPADIPEQRQDSEPPRQYALRLAQQKARAVAAREPGAFVLGADTIVCADEHVLEKPTDAADAARMLRLLSGRTHQVTTAVCLVGPDGEDTATETTEVLMTTISEDEIRAYVATGEPMDKAGAYAIQGHASRWVTRIDGCYFNVVGLPVPLVYRLLRRHGVIAAG
jgi:nucleoside triphosphate pyrophosphatase